MASARSTKPALWRRYFWHLCAIVLGVMVAVAAVYFVLPTLTSVSYGVPSATSSILAKITQPKELPKPVLDVADYRRRLLALAQVATSSPYYAAFLQGTTTPLDAQGHATTTTLARPLWPVWRAAEPNAGAILPFKRVVAYYGNFYSKGMGVLGEYDRGTVLAKLKSEVAGWEAADPTTPVIPAIEYIDVTAQGSPGKDGKYRLRMPDTQIDQALSYAKDVNGIVILDIQPGLSTVQAEVPLIDSYLKMPTVHLALDPEFAMHNGTPPGRVIGSLDADDINWVIEYLSNLVRENNLPPKILVIHRFTEDMVANYKKIKPTPEVQVVMQMDGWGGPARKKNTYYTVIS
ncbi:MAG TPA: hypothetical protein VGP13_03420, partial [Candidatus Paceibacterota bacterium]|nr:hypothetical protein [Candidatus Paceibacterota bacterium]